MNRTNIHSLLDTIIERTASVAQRWRAAAALGMVALQVGGANATGLPSVTVAGGAASGDYLTQYRDYIGLAIGLFALIIVGYGFLEVAGGSLTKFKEWRAGKAELGELKSVMLFGGLVLVIVVFLVTQAAGLIATSSTFTGSSS